MWLGIAITAVAFVGGQRWSRLLEPERATVTELVPLGAATEAATA
jgi:hypothetical protein